MNTRLSKAVTLSNLKIRTKLWVVVAVLAVPILSLVFAQYQVRQDEISKANSESDGISYIAVIVPLLRDVQLHRGLTEQVASGNLPAKETLSRAAIAVDGDLDALQKVDGDLGGGFRTGGSVAAIKTQWAQIKEAAAGQPTRDTANAHADLVATKILPLLSNVGKESQLFLDPSVDTRSVIVALTEDLPRMTESLARARGFGAAALFERDGQAPTEAQKTYLTEQVSQMSAEYDAMARDVEVAMAKNPAFEKALRPLLQRSQTSKESFVTAAYVKIINNPKLSAVEAPIFLLLGGSSIDASNKILEGSRGALKQEFDSRISDAQASLLAVTGGTAVGVLLAVALAIAIAQTITRPLQHLADVADRMSMGELEVEIDVNQNDEIGKLAESLRRMQTSLRSAIERLRARKVAAA